MFLANFEFSSESVEWERDQDESRRGRGGVGEESKRSRGGVEESRRGTGVEEGSRSRGGVQESRSRISLKKSGVEDLTSCRSAGAE